MAILSSLFGSPGQQQPAVGAQPLSTAEIPKQLAPYYTDILGKAQALYDKRVEEGFKPYEGPTIAQFTPEQEATFTGIAGLQGQVAPKFAEAEQLTRDAAAKITGEQLQEAMSPYQQAVTDIEKRESQKAFEQNVLPKLRAAQVAQGSFGGTRGTLLEAQAIADQQQQLADIQSKGSAAAFTDARRALEAERTRMGQGATQLANIAPAALKTGLAELGAQQTVGETNQRQAQTALDEAYRQFLQEKQEPYEAMQKYQAVVTGAPLTTTQFAPPPAPGPSLGQTLLGGATTAAGLYGAFTGQNPLAAVGLMGKKEGGGIADALPLIKKDEGGRLAKNFKAANRQGVLGILGDFFTGRNPYEAEDVANRRGGLMEGRDPAREGRDPAREEPQVDDFGGVQQAIYENKIRESDLAGEELARRIAKNKPNLQNVLRNPEGGKFVPDTSGITKSKPISKKYKGELQKIFEENERLKKEKIDKGEGQNLIAQTQPQTTGLSDFEKNIRTKEDALVDMLRQAPDRFGKRVSEAEDKAFKDKAMAVANLGLRIMSSPSQGNLITSIATAAQDDQTLDRLAKANDKLTKIKNDAEDKIFAAKTGLAKEELGVELNREERDQVRKAREADKKYKENAMKIANKELKIKEEEVEILKNQSQVDAKDFNLIDRQLDELLKSDFIMVGGERKYVGSEGLDPDHQRELRDVRLEAARLLNAAGSLENYYANYAPIIKQRINGIFQRAVDEGKAVVTDAPNQQKQKPKASTILQDTKDLNKTNIEAD